MTDIFTWMTADDWPPEDDAPGRNIGSSLSEVSPPSLEDLVGLRLYNNKLSNVQIPNEKGQRKV